MTLFFLALDGRLWYNAYGELLPQQNHSYSLVAV